jgi:uncharacterized membrane protein YgdD (TMEM256/DUF423 family)
MTRFWLAIAGLGGLVSVAAGAIAAHLEGVPHAALLLHTGALYGMVHAAALLATVALRRHRAPPDIATIIAGWGFAAGIVLFSGSLFLLALSRVAAFGDATPFGGIAFMVGWAALAFTALRPL